MVAPLDILQLSTISSENKVAEPEKLKFGLDTLKAAGTDGVMVDCWWGIVEGKGPGQYDWSGYQELFNLVRQANLKLQVHDYNHCVSFNTGKFHGWSEDLVPNTEFCSLINADTRHECVIIFAYSLSALSLEAVKHQADRFVFFFRLFQVVMSFHQCGGNVGDDVFIPLPQWVLDAGMENPDIFFTNQAGTRNPESLSFGVDYERVLAGRTGLEVIMVFQGLKFQLFLNGLFFSIF